jgi:hypothetical protein
MHIQNAIRLLREACALQNLALNTEKSYAHRLARYPFLKKSQLRQVLASTSCDWVIQTHSDTAPARPLPIYEMGSNTKNEAGLLDKFKSFWMAHSSA